MRLDRDLASTDVSDHLHVVTLLAFHFHTLTFWLHVTFVCVLVRIKLTCPVQVRCTEPWLGRLRRWKRPWVPHTMSLDSSDLFLEGSHMVQRTCAALRSFRAPWFWVFNFFFCLFKKKAKKRGNHVNRTRKRNKKQTKNNPYIATYATGFMQICRP